ncbi:MAG TPA: serine hydrolase [Opitutaceae bacterium]
MAASASVAIAATPLGDTWPVAAPAAHGLSAARLEGSWLAMEQLESMTFLVIKSDHVVFERYAGGYSRTKPHYTASLAKALVGGTSLIVAMGDGLISPAEPAARFIPAWRDSAEKSRITVAQLATHTSGIDDANTEGVPHRDLPGWKGDFWRRLPPPRDPFTLARDEAPLVAPPGTEAHYSNPGMAMLAWCVTASLRGTADEDLVSLLRHRVMEPIGVPANEWTAGYNGPVKIDGLPLAGNWGGAEFSPNAAARVGRLLMHSGQWNGQQILSEDAVRAATTHAGLPNHSGLGWWVNRRADGSRFFASAPADAFFGLGAGGQFLLVVPSLDLIVVRNGLSLPGGKDVYRRIEKVVVDPVMEAFEKPAAPPYPPSPAIARIEWAPTDTIVRRAPGGDNWPTTWTDDDSLFTAYGDGNGFEPHIADRLSLGLARIEGTPPDFRGVNFRSPSGEQIGDGRSGRKASGLLMVDGTLYLLARNAGHSQLAWSNDRGKTWVWADWTFRESLGCPAFVQFGQNYAGARDDFVYILSPDTDTAYQRADRLVLARVPKNRLRDRSAYEFFVRRDADGTTRWSANIAERGAIFEQPGAVYRSHMTWHPALRRYLLTVIGRGADTRFAGGFAIYDAPEPWGPWTTAAYYDTWDTGPGESCHFPSKWLDRDGGWLVFSGNDSFSVRRANIVPRAEPAAPRE